MKNNKCACVEGQPETRGARDTGWVKGDMMALTEDLSPAATDDDKAGYHHHNTKEKQW